MARPSGPKDFCGGRWTKARRNSFITSKLRAGTRQWAPISDVEKAARVRRGVYLCNGCKKEVPKSIRDGRKKIDNVFVDHIEPVVNPDTGFTTWDDYINKLFCEADNLQVLCKDCHDRKSKEENERAINRRAREKQN